jgi:hypothetical protein
MLNGAVDALPLWGLFVVTLFLILLSVEVGYRLGDYRRRRSGQGRMGHALPGA